MRLLTDTVEDDGFATSQHTHAPKKTKQSTATTSRQNSNQSKVAQTRSSESLSSDESSMTSSPSSADYGLDTMYHDQQSSLSMLDIKDPFYEPFFGSLGVAPTPVTDSSNNNNYNANDFALQSSTQDVLQQFFPGSSNNTVLDQQQMNNLFMKPHQQKKSKKSNILKKHSKKPKKSISQNSIINDFSSMNFDAMLPLPTNNSSTWIDSSIYPMWPNYICLYLEYSLPYDPSVNIYTQNNYKKDLRIC